MTKPKHDVALRRKPDCKRLTRRSIHDNQFRQTQYEENQLSENSSAITYSPAPVSTSIKIILRENKSLNTLAQSSKEKDIIIDTSSKELLQPCFLLFQTDILSSIIDLLGICPLVETTQ